MKKFEYRRGLIEKLKAAGYTYQRVLDEHVFGQGTYTRIRRNEPLSMRTLEKICNILNCGLIDIIKTVDVSENEIKKEKPEIVIPESLKAKKDDYEDYEDEVER